MLFETIRGSARHHQYFGRCYENGTNWFPDSAQPRLAWHCWVPNIFSRLSCVEIFKIEAIEGTITRSLDSILAMQSLISTVVLREQ
jgi:hypothetical protein